MKYLALNQDGTLLENSFCNSVINITENFFFAFQRTLLASPHKNPFLIVDIALK